MTDFEIFAKPIPKRYSNIFIEFVSLEVLKYMYPDKYYNLQLVDKPDLQDKDNLIGVEVVEAVSNRIAQIDGEFYNYRFGKQLQYEKEKCIEKLKKNGALLDEYGITYPVQNSIDELEILKHAVVKKLEKFDNYDPKGHSYSTTLLNRKKGTACPICAMERHTSFPEKAIFYYIKKCFNSAKENYHIICFNKFT